jgi:hypothetical protein
MKPKHPPGPPMTLGNMREIGHNGFTSDLNIHASKSREPSVSKTSTTQ